MGRWCHGHHERSKEVGKEGGWIIMKKQAPQNAIQSTCVLRSGGKNFKWWGVAIVQGEVLMMHDSWRRMGGSGKEIFELVAEVEK